MFLLQRAVEAVERPYLDGKSEGFLSDTSLPCISLEDALMSSSGASDRKCIFPFDVLNSCAVSSNGMQQVKKTKRPYLNWLRMMIKLIIIGRQIRYCL